VEEAAAPGQVSVWAAAFLAAVDPARAEARVAAVEARAVRAAEVAPRLMQEICGVRRGQVAVAERPAEAEVESALAAPVVSEVEALELARAVQEAALAQVVVEASELARAV
jgi:hypothetical protein